MTLQVQRNLRKPFIANGRAYAVLDAHYRVRWRLQGRVWKGPLVDALLRKRDEGVPLRVAVAHMYRDLRRLESRR